MHSWGHFVGNGRIYGKKLKIIFLTGTFLIVCLILSVYFYITKIGRRPFADLQTSDIKQAYILHTFYPNAAPYPLNQEDTETLVAVLQEIVFYQRDNTYMDWDGCSFTALIIETTEGEVWECYERNPFFIINGEGRRTKYKPSDNLGWLLQSFMDRAFEEGFYVK